MGCSSRVQPADLLIVPVSLPLGFIVAVGLVGTLLLAEGVRVLDPTRQRPDPRRAIPPLPYPRLVRMP